MLTLSFNIFNLPTRLGHKSMKKKKTRIRSFQYGRLIIFIIHSKWLLRFWLAKSTSIIHHNQLQLTKFGRILSYWTDDVKSVAKVADYWTVNRENLGMRLSCFGGENKMANSRRNMLLVSRRSVVWKRVRTAKRLLDRRHQLFGVYLWAWTDLYFLYFPVKITIDMNYINRGKQALACF